MVELSEALKSIQWFAEYFVLLTSVGINMFFVIRKVQKIILKRNLKGILSVKEREVHILVSENLDEEGKVMITFEQTCVVSYISNLYQGIGINVEIKSLSAHTENQKIYSEVCIGGPLDNVLTDGYIASYFPGFQTVIKDGRKKYLHKHCSKIIMCTTGECGFFIDIDEKKYNFEINNHESDYFVLIKLDESDLKENRNVLMIFGYTRKGLVCGAKFMVNNYKKIYKKHKKNHFFIIGKCSTYTMSFIKNGIEDLTYMMFKDGGR